MAGAAIAVLPPMLIFIFVIMSDLRGKPVRPDVAAAEPLVAEAA